VASGFRACLIRIKERAGHAGAKDTLIQIGRAQYFGARFLA
jgi:hypothetical protein